MIRSLYTATSSLITLENKQSVITNNMANANTTGFKNDDLIMKSFDEVLISNKDKVINGENYKNKLGTITLGSEIDEVNTKFTQGIFKETMKVTDLAIEGRGFFTINQNNQTLYTRDGNFVVGIDGLLSTTDGGKVLGRNLNNGNIEPIYIGNNNFKLDAMNNIYVNDIPTYELHMSDFLDYSTLEKVGDNYYTGNNPINNTMVFVNQGFLESSNVNLTEEMTNMISTMRNFETNQKIMQMLDDTLGRAATEIGVVK